MKSVYFASLAAACGKPIIVGNEDGSQEAVLPDVTGYIMAPADQDTYIEQVRALLLDSARCTQMGLAGHQRILREFSYEGFRKKTHVALQGLFNS